MDAEKLKALAWDILYSSVASETHADDTEDNYELREKMNRILEEAK